MYDHFYVAQRLSTQRMDAFTASHAPSRMRFLHSLSVQFKSDEHDSLLETKAAD